MSVLNDLLPVVRFFGAFERESICCGTVTVAQCGALQALLETKQDVTGLAELSGSSASATTRLVDTLARKGWVERQRDPDDRRRVWVRLTDEGRAEAERLRGMTMAGIDQVMGFVPIAKRPLVVEALGLLRDAMERAAATGIACCGPSGRSPADPSDQ